MPAKWKRPIKRSPKSDPQQYRLYRMEAEAIGCPYSARLSRKQIRRLVRAICKHYGVPQAVVQFRDLKGWSAHWESTDSGVIVFNPNKGTAMCVLTVLHELAHHLHCHLLGPANAGHAGIAAHGPGFMACYMSILDTARMIPVCAMKAICDQYRIQYVDPGTGQNWKRLKKAALTSG